MFGYGIALETDDELRARLLYVAGDGSELTQRIRTAHGDQLEAIASSYNLKRRTSST